MTWNPHPSTDEPRYGPDPTRRFGTPDPGPMPGFTPEFEPLAAPSGFRPAPPAGRAPKGFPPPDTWTAPYPVAPYPTGDQASGRPGPPPPRTRRGQVFSGAVLVLAVVVAVVLGLLIFLALATVRVTTPDPLGAVSTWLTAIGVTAGVAVVVLVLAVAAVVRSRPRFLAVAALVTAVVAPVALGQLALSSGLAIAARHAALDGGELADLVRPVLERYGVDTGRFADLLDEWAGPAAG